jgi:hypothetical protein
MQMQFEDEVWKDYYDRPDVYEVSNCGRVRNKKTGRILNGGIDYHGLLMVNLTIDGRSTNRSVAKMVAELFLPNPDFHTHVTHKNGNTEDNCVDNLRWFTPRASTRYAWASTPYYRRG